MNRLLQGDVGSGKTAVAAHAMLLAVAHGHQAMMAPTGILAEQHHASLSRLRGAPGRWAAHGGHSGGGASVAGSTAGRLAALLVSTHALFSEDTDFARLGLAIIDEQHRFGVEQRRGSAGSTTPDTCPTCWSAAAHPATLSLTIFGDLDVSTIHELLRDGSDRVVTPDRAGDVYGYLAERVAAGEQNFVVVPAVEESDAGLSTSRDIVPTSRAGPSPPAGSG